LHVRSSKPIYGSGGEFHRLHGLGFHALQTLPILGWLTERAKFNDKRARVLIHVGSTFWLISIILIGVQTILGRTTFEMSVLPMLVVIALLSWLATSVVSFLGAVKYFSSKGNQAEINLNV